MMMRWWIGFLLLLNAIVLAWQWDAFGRWGWGPNAQSEPERLLQQLKPEALNITVPGRDVALPSPPPVPDSPPSDKATSGSEATVLPPKAADAAMDTRSAAPSASAAPHPAAAIKPAAH